MTDEQCEPVAFEAADAPNPLLEPNRTENRYFFEKIGSRPAG